MLIFTTSCILLTRCDHLFFSVWCSVISVSLLIFALSDNLHIFSKLHVGSETEATQLRFILVNLKGACFLQLVLTCQSLIAGHFNPICCCANWCDVPIASALWHTLLHTSSNKWLCWCCANDRIVLIQRVATGLPEQLRNLFMKEHFGSRPAKLQIMLLHYIKCVKLKSVSTWLWAFVNVLWYK